jgi:hypothetical protein
LVAVGFEQVLQNARHFAVFSGIYSEAELSNITLIISCFLVIERLMKKLLVVIFLLFCRRAFSATLFSITGLTETWTTVDLEYGCFFKNPFDPEVTTEDQFGSFGTGLTFLSFDDWRNWGLFIHGYFLFPNVTVSTKVGGAIVTKETINNMIGGIAGPVFRIMFGMNSFVYFSLGVHFRYLTGSYTSMFDGVSMPEDWYALDGINIGAGGDIGLKFELSSIFYLNFGVIWTYDIISDIFLDDPNRITPKYLWIAGKPYLGFGTKISVDKAIYVRIGD